MSPGQFPQGAGFPTGGGAGFAAPAPQAANLTVRMEESTFPILDTGFYHAVIESIAPENQQFGPVLKWVCLMLGFQEEIRLTAMCTYKLTPKSKLCEWLAALGWPNIQMGQEVPISSLIGKQVMVYVQKEDKGGRVYSNIKSFALPPSGTAPQMAAPQAPQQAVPVQGGQPVFQAPQQQQFAATQPQQFQAPAPQQFAAPQPQQFQAPQQQQFAAPPPQQFAPSQVPTAGPPPMAAPAPTAHPVAFPPMMQAPMSGGASVPAPAAKGDGTPFF